MCILVLSCLLISPSGVVTLAGFLKTCLNLFLPLLPDLFPFQKPLGHDAPVNVGKPNEHGQKNTLLILTVLGRLVRSGNF